MKRVAAHYLFVDGKLHRMHYAEMTDESVFLAHYPLNDEIHSTAFYDGVLIIASQLPKEWQEGNFYITLEKEKSHAKYADTPYGFLYSYAPLLTRGETANVYLLTVSLPSSELGTDYTRRHCHIKRL